MAILFRAEPEDRAIEIADGSPFGLGAAIGTEEFTNQKSIRL
ncbi:MULTISPECIES: hypothetical protein [Amycolatopsis]|nr:MULTISPECIES: hypothetical protein [Amycolatopsis]